MLFIFIFTVVTKGEENELYEKLHQSDHEFYELLELHEFTLT